LDRSENNCRYAEDQVPPRTSSKSRQRTRRARVPACPKALAPTSRLGAALGPLRVPVAPAPTSQLGAAPGLPRVPVAPAPASWLKVALEPPRVAWAPAPTFWLKAALELPRAPRTGSTGRKQLNKYPLGTHHDLHQGMCARIFQGTTRQGLLHAFTRRAAGGLINDVETCGQAGCRAMPAQQTCSPVPVVCHSAKWFNNSRPTARLGR
jgi:hypothetical protein